jgi:hypothetical protein
MVIQNVFESDSCYVSMSIKIYLTWWWDFPIVIKQLIPCIYHYYLDAFLTAGLKKEAKEDALNS